MLNEEIFETAIKKWGQEAQIGMALEEMGELITAINHYKRHRIGFPGFMEEVVDVYIMMQQLRHLNSYLFDKIFEEKVNRIKKRLEDV